MPTPMTRMIQPPSRLGLLNRRRLLRHLRDLHQACHRGFAHQGEGGILREDGRSIVEFAFASIVLIGMLFGIIYTSLALYTFHYVSEAAREASRYAMVRGSTCHTNTPGLTDCPTNGNGITSAQLQTYMQNLGYPGIDAVNKMTVAATWYTPGANLSSPTLCTTGTCEAPGNIVKVQVTYTFPLKIPFSTQQTLNLTSTSQMVIAQ